MSDKSHSPGPWQVVNDPCNGIDIKDAAGRTLAAIWDRTGDDEPVPTAPADARLITAAPELLAALRDLSRAFEVVVGRAATARSWGAYKVAADLIARIEGVEPNHG